MTITSLDDSISNYLEFRAPLSQQRLIALKKLKEAGIKTYAFVGPLLPNFVFEKNNLDALFKKLKETKVDEIWVEHINLSAYIKERLTVFLSEKRPP